MTVGGSRLDAGRLVRDGWLVRDDPLLPHGTPQARLGLALGQIVGGVITTVGGVTGEALGGAATVTGLGAAVGVPALVVSTGLVVGGVGNIAAGVRGLSQSMMSTGSGNATPGSTKGMGGRTLSPLEQAKFNSFGKRATSAGLKPSPYRTGSWGRIDSAGKYHEVTRIDVAEAGQPGWRGQTHMHVEGMDDHLPLTTKIPGEL